MVQNVQEIYDKFKAYLSISGEQSSILDGIQQLVLLLSDHPSLVTADDLLKLLINLRSDGFNVKEFRTGQDEWKKYTDNQVRLERSKVLNQLHKKGQQMRIQEIGNREAQLHRNEKEHKMADEDDETVEKLKNDRKNLYHNTVPNLLEDADFFEYGGIGLPQEELFAIHTSMKVLAKDHDLWHVRFFGKITGTMNSYIICETNRTTELESSVGTGRVTKEGDISPENAGIGANMWQYWVCSKAGDPWILLPDVTPSQIIVARNVRKFFSGDLQNSMRTYPSFPGNEANYLRAQIARVAAGTMIAPKGLLIEPEDEDEDEDEDEMDMDGKQKKEQEQLPKPLLVHNPEFEQLSLEELMSLENVVHIYPHIRKTGRCTTYVLPKQSRPNVDGEEDIEEEEEEEEEEDQQEDEENPDNVALLRELQQDKQLVQPLGDPKKKKKRRGTGDDDDDDDSEEEEEETEEEEDESDEQDEDDNPKKRPPMPSHLQKKQPAWSTRLCNSSWSKSHSVVIVRSHRWPGAYTFLTSEGKRYGNVYIGNGCKSMGGMAFAPFIPPAPMIDPANLVEALDPTRVNEKRMLQGEEPRDENEMEGDSEEEEETDNE